MTERDDTGMRSQIKTELLHKLAALSLQQALSPQGEPDIDQLIHQLEALNPTPQPLVSPGLATLLGRWNLVYASRGTVVSRQVASVPARWPGVVIQQVWQVLSLKADTQQVMAENGATLNLSWLGDWNVRAHGRWSRHDNLSTATVTFHSFSVQAVWQGVDWPLPSLTMPVLEAFRNEALWTTSFLEDDLRVGRGATGNLFLFQRSQT